jgi:FAD dependent oxidoreductase
VSFPVGVHINPLNDQDGSLLPLLRAEQPLPLGQADQQIQAYNFRLCVTNSNAIRVPFAKPDDYNPRDWELLRRFWLAWRNSTTHTNPWKHQQGMVPSAILGQIPSSMSNAGDTIVNKFDANNCGYNIIHTDMIGGSWEYPEANYSYRNIIWDAHVSYTKAFLWFMSSDDSVPVHIRSQYATEWGYCGDEFHETQHFPPQLYVREARRLVGDRVFTQNDAMSKMPRFNESVGMGCYGFDSHCVERYACTDPKQCTVYKNTPYANWQCGCNLPDPGIYQMPIWVLFPKKHQVRNLLVPVCSSASHVAYATLRMEPQFMMLGHAAGVIAALSVQTGPAVQDVNRDAVAERLLRDGQILALHESSTIT